MPSCLTWKLQPWNISINKILKENLRKRYVNDCIKTNKQALKKHNNRMGGQDLELTVCNHEQNDI